MTGTYARVRAACQHAVGVDLDEHAAQITRVVRRARAMARNPQATEGGADEAAARDARAAHAGVGIGNPSLAAGLSAAPMTDDGPAAQKPCERERRGQTGGM